MTGAPEGEEPVGTRFGSVAVEVEEAVGDPGEEQGDLSVADRESLLVYSTAELQHRCLDVLLLLSSTMALNAHPRVHPRTH